MSERNLPIKMIIPRSTDYINNTGGGKDKFFCEVTDQLQTEIINQFSELNDFFGHFFEEEHNVPAIGKVKIRDEAIAKSHRPNDLLQECPIVGVGKLDELYIKVTAEGIAKTIEKIRKLPSKKVRANLTTIVDVEPYSSDDKISVDLVHAQDTGIFEEVKNRIKIKLFCFDDEYEDAQIHRYVERRIMELGLKEKYEYFRIGTNIEYIKMQVNTYDDIKKISEINGVKSIDFFQTYSTPIQEFSLSELEEALDDGGANAEIIIGIIDGGISKENPFLEPYVQERVEYVPEKYQNHCHGTFIASTIQHGNHLNNIDGDNRKYKFLDVVAIPNSDPKFGATDKITEDDLMTIIEEVMEEYSERVKIWNLSLGVESKKCCDVVSDLGEYLDSVQERYGVQIIVSSGNINQLPLREWPPQDGLGEHDRLISPADSVRAITVGSIALYDSSDSIVNKGEPSPFSRRGPGANFIIKPDLVDYGGNYKTDYSIAGHAMIGLGLKGEKVEGNGTSYSTPRIVKKFADIYDDLIEKDLMLSKAMAVHSARINYRDVLGNDELIKYYGFGMPQDNVSDILQCRNDEITLIFKQSLVPGSHLELKNFPYPQSLIKNDKFIGEIGMTLAYNPELDARFGQEYCRVNIDVSFGTYEYLESGKEDFKGQVPLEKNWDGKFEKAQVEHGFKWSPIKSYYRKLSKGIQIKNGWKLRIDMHGRSNMTLKSQEFVLIMTIKDPNGNDIYSEMVNGLRDNGYITNNLEVRQTIRERH